MCKSRRSSEAKSLAIFRLSILCLQIVLNGRQNGDLENSDRTWENLLDLKFIVIVDFFADSARSRRYRLWKCPRKIDDFRLDQPNLFNAELSRVPVRMILTVRNPTERCSPCFQIGIQ